MSQEPSAKSPANMETRPSLLATMSLVLAIVPFVLAAQFFLRAQGYHPSWLSRILSTLMPMQMLVMMVAPLISIFCGIAARVQTGKDPSLRGRWKAIVGVYLAIIFYLCFLLTPRLSIPRSKARAAACISNLKAIATAITMYADDHENQMPAKLAELLNDTYFPVGSTALECPESHKPYRYPGAGRTWNTNWTEIAVYCGTDHLSSTNALYNDGRVARTSSAAVKASVAAIRSEKK